MNDHEKKILDREEKREKVAHTLTTAGWQEEIEPYLNKMLAAAESNIKQAFAADSIEKSGKQFIENYAVKNFIDNFNRKINAMLNGKEN